MQWKQRKIQEIALENAKDAVLKVAKEFKKISGRSYGLFEEYKTKDADYIMLLIGSAAGTAKQAVDDLRAKGKKSVLSNYVCSVHSQPMN